MQVHLYIWLWFMDTNQPATKCMPNLSTHMYINQNISGSNVQELMFTY